MLLFDHILLRLEKPETCGLFVADYGFHPLYLPTRARNVALQSFTVTKKFNINLYDMNYLNPEYKEGLL
jgi:hypothetical protein